MTADTDAEVAAPSPPRTRTRSSRQVQESARNKAEIVKAAVTVFAEKGYAATTLEGVARLVGLTRQGVLHHFPSKEVLFAAVIADQDHWARGQYSRDDPEEAEPADPVAGALADGGLRGLRVLVPFLGRAGPTRQRLQMVQVLQGEGLSGNAAARTFATHRLERVREQITERIGRGRRAGEVRPDIDTAALAVLLTAVINGLQAQWLLDETVDTGSAFDLLLSLVEAPRGDDEPTLDIRLTSQ